MQILDREIFDKSFWRQIAVVLLGISFYFIVLNFERIGVKFKWFIGLLSPFIWGFVFAFLLNGLMMKIENKWFKKVKEPKKKRFWSVVWTLVITLGTVIILGVFLLPQLGKSLAMILNRIPEYGMNLGKFFDQAVPGLQIDFDKITEAAGEFMTQGLTKAFTYSGKIVSGGLNVFIGVVLAIYLLFNKEEYIVGAKKIAYAFLPDVWVYRAVKVLRYGNETFTGFFYSKLLDSFLVGLICFVGMVLMGMPYALLVSVIIALTNIIPFFGPFIGAIPATLLILAVDPLQALWFVLFIFVLQQFDGNIMGPKIMANSIGLPAIWVMFAILVGGGAFGFAGMILGIPVFAMIYNIIREYIDASYLEKSRH
ncbi:AI-2E family transporter [bacterium]|nr:AI-2E family transporter [bacterium]